MTQRQHGGDVPQQQQILQQHVVNTGLYDDEEEDYSSGNAESSSTQAVPVYNVPQHESLEPQQNHHTGFDMSILTSLPTLQPPDHNKIDLVYNKKKIKREEKEKEKLMRAEKVALQQKSSAMNKDYMSMAREYVVTTPFRNLDSQEIKCALCKTGIAKTVFFPCTHKCVCDECIEKNKIGKPGLEGSWNMCPICCDEIKIALPSTGDEVERYWKWVREVKPFIPPNFIRAFHKRSTANIKRLVGGDADRDIYDDGGGEEGKKVGAKVCVIS
ncbi:hypothetical protein TrLO_g14893 [Triparma laevis f. longispina]|uniref:RING-type domain-containing protein n=3 Tax=Triparma laevis TaxID=1534972 RepID=A0A9W7FV01_9STRA|nr:hypothetical protein TrLO_g14893 [Triparma laevis f. longispina]